MFCTMKKYLNYFSVYLVQRTLVGTLTFFNLYFILERMGQVAANFIFHQELPSVRF